MRRDSFPETPEGLTAQEVIAATQARLGHDGLAARAAEHALKMLLATPDRWPELVQQLALGDCNGRYHRVPDEVMRSDPGELLLVRRPGNRYWLLHHQEPHWRLVNGNGGDEETVTGCAIDALQGPVEAVALHLPRDEDNSVAALTSLWPMVKQAWMEIGLASLFVNGGMLLVPLFSMLVYDKVVSNGVFETLWALVAGIIIYLLMDTAMRLVRAWSVEQISSRLAEESDERLWRRLIGQKDVGGGGLAKFLAEYRNLSAARDFVSATYLMGLVDLPFFLLFLVVIGLLAWPILILVAILATIYGLLGLANHRRSTSLGREAEQTGTRKLTFISETLNTLDLARTTPGAHLLLRRWRSLVIDSASLDARRRLAINHASTLAVAMTTTTTVATLSLGVYLVDARQLTVGGLIATSMLATRAMSLVASLFALLDKWGDFRRASASVEVALAPVDERASVEKRLASGRIDIVGIRKEYPGRPAALEQLSISIAPGEKIGLLGRPGSGKTTLLRCLAGVCVPDDGQILFDGVNLHDISREDRARWLRYKPQDPLLFAGTLDENLRIAGVSPDHPLYAQALWASGLEDELRRGRLSLGMAVAERGANLSGGQRQKVALARTFAQAGIITLLDEPTLGLDAEGEKILADRLPQVISGGVLIMSTHCATLLEAVDRIVAMDGGRIVADGAKSQLLRATPPTAR